MFNFKTQITFAEELLSKLQMIDPFAMVAGGAPRDWELKKYANDLDIYLRMPNHNTLTLVENVLRVFGVYKLRLLTKNENANYEKLPDLKWVFEGYYCNQRINIMVITKGIREEIVSNFDVSLCECWFDGNEIKSTNKYKLTKETKICFVHKNYTGKELHITKMMNRFTDYMFVKEINLGVKCQNLKC